MLDFKAEIKGLEALETAMRGAVKEQRKAARFALYQAGKIINDEAKSRAPVLQKPARYRRPGTVRKAIGIVRHKASAGQVRASVTVRAAPAAKLGAKSPYDPFYWRFLEFGTKHMRKRPFLQPAFRAKVTEAVDEFGRAFAGKLAQLFGK